METKEKRARRNSERLSNSPATSDLYEPDDFSEGLTTYQTESGGLNSSNLYDPFDSEAESADDETYVNFASPNTSECFEPESDIHENDSPIILISGNSNSSKQSDPINSSEAVISPFKICTRRSEQDISGPVPGTAGEELSREIPIVATQETELSFNVRKDDDLGCLPLSESDEEAQPLRGKF